MAFQKARVVVFDKANLVKIFDSFEESLSHGLVMASARCLAWHFRKPNSVPELGILVPIFLDSSRPHNCGPFGPSF